MSYSPVKIRVPDIQKSFGTYNTKTTKAYNIALIKDIYNKYNSFVNKWSSTFAIPRGVIIAFIATESGGQMVAPNRYLATGLMQVTPNAVWDCSRKWTKEVSTTLPSNVTTVLQNNVQNIFISKSAAPNAIQRSAILKQAQFNADFNIMCGTMCLRWLLERFSTFVTGAQLNKAMVAYNAGAYVSALQIPNTTTANKVPIDTTRLYNMKIPAESRSYILKMLGIDGFLSLIYKDKIIPDLVTNT